MNELELTKQILNESSMEYEIEYGEDFTDLLLWSPDKEDIVVMAFDNNFKLSQIEKSTD